MRAPVSVVITTIVGDDTLRYTGSGMLCRDGQGTHLEYSYEDNGRKISSRLHLKNGRAMTVTPSCRILLDPSRPTQTQFAANLITIPLTVQTHCVQEELIDDEGIIRLQYTLLTQGNPLQTLHVTLKLTPLDKESTV